MLVGNVVVTVTCPKFRITFNWYVGRRMRQSLHQAHPDDVGRIAIARNRAPDVTHRFLNAAGNQRGRIKECAVPIKGNQIKAPGRRHIRILHGLQNSRVHGAMALAVRFARCWRDD